MSISPDPAGYLDASGVIDCNHPCIRSLARELAAGWTTDREIAARCYLFVRDEIRHSGDFRQNPVTLKASDVLAHRTGFCYAKSHLLAALLRANGIPAGLCYQRLSGDDPVRPFYLHGLNAVFLNETGWLRIDARGNRPGVDAQFTPPVERLAFIPCSPGERSLPGIYTEPLPVVVAALARCRSFEELLRSPPDWEEP